MNAAAPIAAMPIEPLVLALARVAPAIGIALAVARVGLPRSAAAALAAIVALAVVALGEPSVAAAGAQLASAPLATQAALIAREAVVGVALGVTAAIPLIAAELAGGWLAAALGDTDDHAPWSTATAMLGALVFFGLGGHRAVMAAVIGSYRAMPAAADLASVTAAAASLVAVALALAVPVLGAVMIAALVLAAVERSSGAGAGLVATAPLMRVVGILALAAMVFAIAHPIAALTTALPTTLR